ncbi:histone-fold-containing protein [Geranomyces variabilis]|nr:histone-fold-containing protein [Geranomyces variabilis]
MSNIENLDLPRSIIGRVIKNALPEGAQIQKDAKAAMIKGCTVFINYLTATALDVTKQGDRKSINANDIFRALSIIEFDQFLPTIKVAVAEFQQKAKEKRQEYKRNFKEKHASANSAAGGKPKGDAESGDEHSMHHDGDSSFIRGEEMDGGDSGAALASSTIPQKRPSMMMPSGGEASKRPRASLADGSESDDGGGSENGDARSDDE